MNIGDASKMSHVSTIILGNRYILVTSLVFAK